MFISLLFTVVKNFKKVQPCDLQLMSRHQCNAIMKNTVELPLLIAMRFIHIKKQSPTLVAIDVYLYINLLLWRRKVQIHSPGIHCPGLPGPGSATPSSTMLVKKWNFTT